MHALDQAVLYDYELAGERLRLWKRVGESYEHVLMKALGYAMFAGDYPDLKIEQPVGLRYKPDLVALGAHDRFLFWGECGQVTVKKIAWLLKHARPAKLVVFKINRAQVQPLAEGVRAEVPVKYRPAGRVEIIGFAPDIIERTLSRCIPVVPPEWYAVTPV